MFPLSLSSVVGRPPTAAICLLLSAQPPAAGKVSQAQEEIIHLPGSGKKSAHWQVPWAQCSFLCLIFSCIFDFLCYQGLQSFSTSLYVFIQYHVLKNHTSLTYVSFHETGIVEYIFLFEEGRLEISFHACTVAVMSLSNCCYEGAKKNTQETKLVLCFAH